MKESAWKIYRRLKYKYLLNFNQKLWSKLYSKEKIKRIGNNDTFAGEFLNLWTEKKAIKIMKEIEKELIDIDYFFKQ